MGADIHFYVETFNSKTNRWVYRRKLSPGYLFRNYKLFSVLADVRNYTHIKPIESECNLPDDTSKMLMKTSECIDFHSHRCYTLKTLIEAMEMPASEVVSSHIVHNYVGWVVLEKDLNIPLNKDLEGSSFDSYFENHHIKECDIEYVVKELKLGIIDFETCIEKIKLKFEEQGKVFIENSSHVLIHGEELTYADFCGTEFLHTLDRFKTYADENKLDYDSVRFIMWFDN